MRARNGFLEAAAAGPPSGEGTAVRTRTGGIPSTSSVPRARGTSFVRVRMAEPPLERTSPHIFSQDYIAPDIIGLARGYCTSGRDGGRTPGRGRGFAARADQNRRFPSPRVKSRPLPNLALAAVRSSRAASMRSLRTLDAFSSMAWLFLEMALLS